MIVSGLMRQSASRDDGMLPDDLRGLVTDLLSLGLDPATAPVALDLDAALTAALDAYQDDDQWRTALPYLASIGAHSGRSHRRGILILQLKGYHIDKRSNVQHARCFALLHDARKITGCL